MSKVFEEEYRQLAQNEIPDLWERIEAGLSEKSVSATSAPKKKVVSIRKYAGLIAACLCAAVVIPAAINIGNNSKNADNSAASEAPAPASEEAYDMITEEAPVFEMEEPEAGTVAEETKEASKAEMEEGRAYGESADGTEDQSLADEMGRASEISEIREEAQAVYTGVLTDGMVIKGVILKVITAETLEGITVYGAVVQEDPNDLLIQEGQITCTKGLYMEEELTAGESYRVNLHYYEEDPYLFEVSRILH